MLCRSFALNKCIIVPISDDADETLHLFNCCIHNRISIHGSRILFTVICKVFAKDQDLRHLVNAEFLAKFLFLETINSANFNHSVQFLCNCHILIFERLAFFEFGVEEVDYPDLLSAIELENLT